MSFINSFDKNYNPLSNDVTIAEKMNKLMSTFPEIMEVMNEKKQHFIYSFLDKARETMRRLGFTPSIGVGPLIVQKRSGYTVIQIQRPIIDKGNQIVKSTSVVFEERSFEPSPKRRKIIRGDESHDKSYSPSQNPMRIEEHLIDE